MRRFAGWIGLLAVLLLGLGFAASNAGRQVTIDVGLFTLYRVPITFVAFGGMLVGMGVVLLAGINSDLKVRALLEGRGRGSGQGLEEGSVAENLVEAPAREELALFDSPEVVGPGPTKIEEASPERELPLE